jgi:NitT/TauT family transport system permease protein
VQGSIVGVLVLAWAIVTEAGLVDHTLLPTVGATLTELKDLVTTSEGWMHINQSLKELGGSLAVGVPLGMVVGYAVGQLKLKHNWVGRISNAVFDTMLATPKSILLPVFLAIFGVTYQQKVAYIMIDALLIVAMALTVAGFASDSQARLLAQAIGASKLQFFVKFYVPSVLPTLVEAIRLSVILMMGGVLLAEMYIASAGIGYLMADWALTYNLPALFAGVILVAIIATVINTLFLVLEKRLSRWRIES